MNCYYCDNEATTDEHIPPKCIFPTGFRKNLITVRACHLHNAAKSGDDEYLRNVLVSCLSINSAGQSMLSDKALRSILRNQYGSNNIIRSPQVIDLNGVETLTIAPDYRRIVNVLSLMSSAFVFRDTGRRVPGRWLIALKDLARTAVPFFTEILGQIETLSSVYASEFQERPTENKEIFRYFFFEKEGVMIYRYLFYGGVEVFALTSRQVSEGMKRFT